MNEANQKSEPAHKLELPLTTIFISINLSTNLSINRLI